MKVALLGLSHPHSGILLATLENLPAVTGVRLWDADASVVARPPVPASAKVTGISGDLDAVLDDAELAFAIVCVRHDQAAAVAHRVAAAGKPFIVEKPAGLTSGEIAGLRAACERAGVLASVLYTRRFHPCVVAARRLVQSGALGPLLSFETRFLTTQVKFRDPASWLFRRSQAGGGILLWLGCHCLDLLHHVTGDEIAEVGAFLATRSGEAIDVEDTAALILKFRSGAIGTFHAGYTLAYSGAGYVNTDGYDSYLGLNGLAGRIVWPDLKPRLFVESAPTGGNPPMREEGFAMPASSSYGGAGGEEFFRQFIAAVRNHGAPPTTLADAERTALIIEAAAESSATGRSVRIKPLTGPGQTAGSSPS
ncbi:MAG: putative dehydrogenase [Verrucomicrobia bacterium]|nr:putative dehydrogenase [Verrucomicrobiota bacterium]